MTKEEQDAKAWAEWKAAHPEASVPHPSAAPTHEFLWLDLETTGLDPHTGLVLEFAAVLCEDARGDDFAIVQQYTGVIGATAEAFTAARATCSKCVLGMHARNGLWADAAASDTTAEEVDAFLAALACDLSGGRKHSITLAGSSVHFDLAWCRVHFPAFAEYLSHRVFDVSTMRRAVDAWCGGAVQWPVRDTHRALADVLASIAECRAARDALRWWG